MSGFEQKSLDFKKSLQVAEKKALSDYSPQEIARNEELLTLAYVNEQKVSGDLLHYMIIRDSTPRK